MFSCPVFFKSSCTYGDDSIEHKLITLKKEQNLCCKPLSSQLSCAETSPPSAGQVDSAEELNRAEFKQRCLQKLAVTSGT